MHGLAGQGRRRITFNSKDSRRPFQFPLKSDGFSYVGAAAESHYATRLMGQLGVLLAPQIIFL